MNYVFQFGDVWAAWPDLLWGCWLTIQLSAVSMVLGLLVAVLGALGKTMGPKPVRWVVDAYVEVIRNTPFLVQIFIIFFGLPRAGVMLTSNQAALLAMVVNVGAYATEIVRAGIEDSVMVDSLGIDVYKVFIVAFGIGAMAAGFAGIVNAPVVSIAPDVGEAILVQTFVVVVIGGVGSFPGAVLGGFIAGEIISITSMFNPGYSYVMLFVAMTLVLVLRPYGLLGTAGRE